jgi:hypothetical protein
MNTPYIKPSDMVKPPGMSWREYMTKAFAEDRAWGNEFHSNAAFEQLLAATCERMAKARLASGPRLVLPKVVKVTAPKASAKAVKPTGFSLTRPAANVERAIARRLAMR